MKTLIIVILLTFTLGCAGGYGGSASVPPDFANMSAAEFQTWQGNELIRLQSAQRRAAWKANWNAQLARQRAFMNNAARQAESHHRRGMSACC